MAAMVILGDPPTGELAEFFASQILKGRLSVDSRFPPAQEISAAWPRFSSRLIREEFARLREAGFVELRGRHYHALHPPADATLQPRKRFRSTTGKRLHSGGVLATSAAALGETLKAVRNPGARLLTGTEFARKHGLTRDDAYVVATAFVDRGLLEVRKGTGGGFFATPASADASAVDAVVEDIRQRVSSTGSEIVNRKAERSKVAQQRAKIWRERTIPISVFSANTNLADVEHLADHLRSATNPFEGTWRLPPQTQLRGALGVSGKLLTQAIRELKTMGIAVSRRAATEYGGTYISRAWHSRAVPRPEWATSREGSNWLAYDIRHKVTEGALYPGEPLPEREFLSQFYGTSEDVVAGALETLVSENVISNDSVVTVGPRSGRSPTGSYFTSVVSDELNHHSVMLDRLPKKERVVHVIAELVTTNRLPAGSQIPPLHDLAAAVPDIGKNTINKARTELINAGVLQVAKVHEGTVVAPGPHGLYDLIVDVPLTLQWLRTAELYEPDGRSMAYLVAFDLRRRIESDELAVTTPLPGRPSLQAIYAASAGAVQDALGMLAEEELIGFLGAEPTVRDHTAVEPPYGLSPLARQLRQLDPRGEQFGRYGAAAIAEERGVRLIDADVALRQLRHTKVWPPSRPGNRGAHRPRITPQPQIPGRTRSRSIRS